MKVRQKLVGTLAGYWTRLAKDKFGSRALDKIYQFSNVNNKVST
jgi:hypothetical protein